MGWRPQKLYAADEISRKSFLLPLGLRRIGIKPLALRGKVGSYLTLCATAINARGDNGAMGAQPHAPSSRERKRRVEVDTATAAQQCVHGSREDDQESGRRRVRRTDGVTGGDLGN